MKEKKPTIINSDLIKEDSAAIPLPLFVKLNKLGMLPNAIRNHNIGDSDYSEHLIQPWAIWIEYNLNPWDADIVKRILRTKSTDPRKKDYEKIIHICQERIRQIECDEIAQRVRPSV